MQSIKDLINKIKWDKNLKPEEYIIGYLDRIKSQVIEIPFNKIEKIEGNSFQITNEKMETVEIPLHRIKIVKRSNKLIWKR
jgi:uncharacterized protein (UPF0248 family)